MAKGKDNTAPVAPIEDADSIIAKAKEEAEKIMAAARAAADSEVSAAKEEAKSISDAAVKGAAMPMEQDQTKRHIKSLRVCAIRRGYANHRIYEPGDKFLYRYWSHHLKDGALVAVPEEKALGGWMVTEADSRYRKTKEELQDVRVAESDEADVTLAAEKAENLNVL